MQRPARQGARRLATVEVSDIKPLFVKRRGLILRLTALLGLSVALMVMDYGRQEPDVLREWLSTIVYPIQVTVHAPLSTVEWLGERLASRRHLLTENARLRTRQVVMEAQLQKLAALKAENARLRELLSSTKRMGERLSIAEIMRLDLDPYRQQIVINRGSANGVYVGQPIIDAHGIFGQITQTGRYTANALLITDSNHSIPVEVNRNGLRTIAQGTGKPNLLELPYLPNNADIQVGDLLVASGLGERFPRGYPVAEVTRIQRNPGERFAQVEAEPAARLDRSREVLLVWKRPAQAAAGDDDASGPAAGS